jgi:4-hydroxybenzoate polyprenyltransferase
MEQKLVNFPEHLSSALFLGEFVLLNTVSLFVLFLLTIILSVLPIMSSHYHLLYLQTVLVITTYNNRTYQVSVHLAKRFQRRRFLEIDQLETRISCGGHAC